jgi:diguanylate cyclase (GGDEF)-like protein
MCGRGRHGDLISVLFLDLDGFKTVNDRFGHDCGNELLVAVTSRLRGCVRPGDVVARMGGDEFTVLLTRLESVAPAVEVAERIATMLADPFTIAGAQVTISASIGISVAPADGADAGDLLRRADVAMYRAKSQGKAGWAMDPSSLKPTTHEGLEH